MTKEKKDKEPIPPSVKLLNEDVRDKELQKRFDGFKRELSYLEKDWEEKVPIYNKKINEVALIKECLLFNARLGFSITEQVQKLIAEENWLSEELKVLDKLKIEIDKQKDLIERYKRGSEAKFFQHWKSQKIHGVTDKDWGDWFHEYKEKEIII